MISSKFFNWSHRRCSADIQNIHLPCRTSQRRAAPIGTKSCFHRTFKLALVWGRLLNDHRRIAAVMRDKYYDPEGWKQCTLRNNLEVGHGLWLLCGTSRKSRYFATATWAREHNVDLDTPFKTLGKRIRCQRCGSRGGERGVGAYGQPYGTHPAQPRRPEKDDPICPRCGSDDVHTWPWRLTDYPPGCKRNPRVWPMMVTCGCERCDNWWTQPQGIKVEPCRLFDR
jgi:hypothetical protein